MTARKDGLREKLNRLSSKQSVRGAELKTVRCRLGTPGTKLLTASEQMTEQNKLKEKAEHEMMGVQYKLGGTKAKIVLSKDPVSRVQEGLD